MGKTIMLAALLHTLREDVTTASSKDESEQSGQRQLRINAFSDSVSKANTAKGSGATLIVAPTSLLSQWAEELERCSKPGSVKVHVWHGTNRLDIDATMDDPEALHVVITSYGTLASEHAKVEKASMRTSPLYRSKFLRF
jgi:DNA repair protein RAD5